MSECEWGEDLIQWRQLCWKGLVAFIYCRTVSIISSSSEWFHRPFFVTMTGARLSRLLWGCLIYHVQYPQIWRTSYHREKVSSSFLSYFFLIICHVTCLLFLILENVTVFNICIMVASRNFSQRLCAHCAKQMDWIKKGKKAEEIITPLLTVLSRVSFKIAQELCKINKLFPMYWNPLSCCTGTGDLHREEWLQIRFARGWGWSLSLQVQILLNAH